MSDLRHFPPVLLAGLLLAAGVLLASCATPERDTPADLELEGTPSSDAVDEESDPDVAETAPDADATQDQQRGEAFEGETLTDAEMTTRASSVGTHLVDGQGRTLYVFRADPDGERTCTGPCLESWPVFSTGEEVPTVDGGVREELVGTIAGEDGGRQVAYNEQPLYYYAGDGEVGDLEGHGVGGQWFAVSPEGPPIDAAAGDG